MDPITATATIIGGIATLVAAWQNRQKSKAELTADTLIAAIEIAEKVDPEAIRKLKEEIRDLADRTGVEAQTLAPAVERLVRELRTRGILQVAGPKNDLAADVVLRARSKWRAMGKAALLALVLASSTTACRLTRESVHEATAEDPAVIVVVWPAGVPQDPAFFETQWSEQEGAMVTAAPLLEE